MPEQIANDTSITDQRTIKLQQISDISWIVHQGSHNIGILNKEVQDHYSFINGHTVEIFNGDDEVKQHFGNIMLFEDQDTTPVVSPDGYYIKGHKVGYDNPIPIEPGDDRYDVNLPLYLKSETSEILYAAGWYCISFDQEWRFGHDIKLGTLLKYGYEGPFQSKKHCQKRLKELKQQQKEKSRG